MSEEFDELRTLAVEIATGELGRHVREIGMQNRGPRVDVYLREAGVGEGTMNDDSLQGERARMWCGMFVYWCYSEASKRLNKPLPFKGVDLWSGGRLAKWTLSNTGTVVKSVPVQAGDIFAVPNGHVGMAIGASDSSTMFETIEGNQSEVGQNWDGIARKKINPVRCKIIVRI